MTSQATLGFAELALAGPVLASLQKVGYEQPFPIQAQCIPPLLDGHDLLGMAQTGTGKTAAFALPLLSRIDISKKDPQVLVLVPTRELAIQVAEAFQTYANAMKGFHVLPIYGGQSMNTQLKQLHRGAHVVVGTPGRVMDHLRRGTLKLQGLTSVVLDEADEMLRMGFLEDVTWILERTPKERQVALFSATMPSSIRKIADRYLNSPTVIKIESKTTTVEKVEQHYWAVSGVNKLDALTRMLEVETFDGIIIFVRTRTMSTELAEKLEARGYSAVAINGDMGQNQRERTIEQLKNGKIDILVATDVAARGIDVTRISHVINYDIPYDTEAYVHRIGRTGRAGRGGKAILFVSPRERKLLRSIEKATGQRITPMELPSREEVNSKRIAQFKSDIQSIIDTQNLNFYRKLTQETLEETQIDAESLAAALAYMSHKDLMLVSKPAKEHRERKDNKERKAKASGDESKQDKKRTKIMDPSAKKGKQSKARFHDEVIDGEMVRMENFRLAVGQKHNATAKDIVGAIANEADIDSIYIRNIQIHKDFSTVDLPEGMPKPVFLHLKKVYVQNRPLGIERFGMSKMAKGDRGKKVNRKERRRRAAEL